MIVEQLVAFTDCMIVDGGTGRPVTFTDCSFLDYSKPTLPFFLDPEQIEALTPEIDWDQRVGDRIQAFLEWGGLGGRT